MEIVTIECTENGAKNELSCQQNIETTNIPDKDIDILFDIYYR